MSTGMNSNWQTTEGVGSEVAQGSELPQDVKGSETNSSCMDKLKGFRDSVWNKSKGPLSCAGSQGLDFAACAAVLGTLGSGVGSMVSAGLVGTGSLLGSIGASSMAMLAVVFASPVALLVAFSAYTLAHVAITAAHNYVVAPAYTWIKDHAPDFSEKVENAVKKDGTNTTISAVNYLSWIGQKTCAYFATVGATLGMAGITNQSVKNGFLANGSTISALSATALATLITVPYLLAGAAGYLGGHALVAGLKQGYESETMKNVTTKVKSWTSKEDNKSLSEQEEGQSL